MERYEYKVVPAPAKGLKAKGIKTPEARFAHALETSMNALGGEGWEYWRAECLPSLERSGLTSSKVTDRHVLVFRRALEPAKSTGLAPQPELAAEPASEPAAEAAPTAANGRERAPVFTRRLEMAREKREELLHQEAAEANTAPRPLRED